MATKGKKISELPITETLSGDEIIPFAKNGSNGGVSAGTLKEYVQDDTSDYVTKETFDEQLANKQDELINSADITIEDSKLSVTERAKRAIFDEIWESLGGTVITPGTTYGLNGLNDLTFADALKIKKAGFPHSVDCVGFYARLAIRTNLWRGIYTGKIREGERMFADCTAEVIFADYVRLNADTFKGCSNLKTILGRVYLSANNSYNVFGGCYNLEDFTCDKQTATQLDVSDCPKLKIGVFNYIVPQIQSGSFSFTVHADVYAKLTDETNTEWYALLSAAAAKNIQFVTA